MRAADRVSLLGSDDRPTFPVHTLTVMLRYPKVAPQLIQLELPLGQLHVLGAGI